MRFPRRTLSLLSCLLLVSLSGHLCSQTTASPEWIRTYQSQINDWDEGKEVARDHAGNVFLLGNVNRGVEGGEILLQKFDPNGVLLWAKGYKNGFGQGDRAIDVKVDSAGNAYTLVDTYFNTLYHQDMMVRKYSPNGNVLWSTYYDGAQRNDVGTVMHVNPAGAVTVAGLSTVGNNAYDHHLVRIDPNGTILWSVNLASTQSTWWNGMDLEVNSSGESYLIASPSMDPVGGLYGDCHFWKISDIGVVEWDTMLLANGLSLFGAEIDLDANQEPVVLLYHEGGQYDLNIKGFDPNGQLRGEAVISLGPYGGDRPHSLVVGPDEFLYVTYFNNDQFSPENRMAKIAPDFHIVWDRLIDQDYSNPPGVFNTMEFMPNGNLLLGGMKDYSDDYLNYDDDLMVLEYDTAGSLVQRLDWDGAGMGKDLFSEMTFDPSGGVLIAGQCMEAIPNRDMTLVRIDLGGGNDWARYYNSFKPGNVYMKGIGIDGTGNSYMVGFVNDADIVAGVPLVKYDPSGNPLWDKVYRIDSLTPTFADEVVVDAAGNVFILAHGAYGLADDLYVIKLDGNGDEVWTYTQGSNTGQNYHGRDIQLDTLGNVYAGANQVMPGFTSRWYLCSLSPAGTLNWEQWATTPNTPGRLELSGFFPDGNGAWAGGEKDGQPFAIKLDATGNQIAQTGPSQVLMDHEDIIFELSDQGLPTFLTAVNDTAGGTPISNQWDWNLIRYDNNGNWQWEKRFPGAAQDEAKPTALAIDANENIFAGGVSDLYSNTIARFEANGGLEWAYVGPVSGNSVRVEVADLLPMPGEGAVYTGRNGQFDYQSIVERIDPQGNLLWTYSYSSINTYEFTRGHSLAVGPSGALYTGIIAETYLNRNDMVMVKLSEVTDLPDPTPSDISIVYPQPAHGHLNVQWEGLRTSSQVKVDLLDVQGRLIHRSTVQKAAPQSTQISIDLPAVSAGIYILQLENQQGKLIRDKVLID